MKFNLKNIFVPKTNEVKSVEAIEIWYVRWHGRNGPYSSDIVPCIEAFPIREQAEDFATSLRNAFQLLRISDNTTEKYTMVTVSRK